MSEKTNVIDATNSNVKDENNFNNSKQDGPGNSDITPNTNKNNDDDKNNNNGSVVVHTTETSIESTTSINISKPTGLGNNNDSNKPESSSISENKIEDKNGDGSSMNTTIIGIGSGAAVIIIALVLFMFLKKRKRNYTKEDLIRERSESEYQISSGFLKTDNHITLPFNESMRDAALSYDNKDSQYYYNSNILSNRYKEDNKTNTTIGKTSNETVVDANIINNNNNKNLMHMPSTEYLLSEQRKDKLYGAYNVNSNNTDISSDINQYCIDMKFETPTLDIAFPKPTHKASSSLSSSWFNFEFKNNATKPSSLSEAVNIHDNSEKSKQRYVTNNTIAYPEQTLDLEEIVKIDDQIKNNFEKEKKSKYIDNNTKDNSEITSLINEDLSKEIQNSVKYSNYLNEISEKEKSMEEQAKIEEKSILDNSSLKRPVKPMSKSSLSLSEKSSLKSNENSNSGNSNNEVVKHSPQTNLTPKKSILKKNNSVRNYNSNNNSNGNSNSNSSSSNGTLTRKSSTKKTTLNRKTSTRSKATSNNANSSKLNGIDESMTESLDDEHNSNYSFLSRANTITSINTSASGMTNMRVPPVLSAFHHALPTPPTPKSTRLFGTDGELVVGQPMNEELMVPDVLTDALGGRDIYSNQVRNIASSYCTIRRNKNKNPRRGESEDNINQENGSLRRKNSSHRRNRSQDFTHARDKLEYFNTMPSTNKQELTSFKNIEKENYQPNLPMGLKENFTSPGKSTNNNRCHYSKTLPRHFGSSKKESESGRYDDNIYIKNIPPAYPVETEKAKMEIASYSKRDSMEAEILIQNANISLTCFEEDLLKSSITEQDTSKDPNSVLRILREERALLDQKCLETPK